MSADVLISNAGIKHHLDEMVDLVPDENPLKGALREIEGLAAYATTYRYTTSSGRIPDTPVEKLAAFAQKVESVLTEAVSRFGVDLPRKNTPATRPGPIR